MFSNSTMKEVSLWHYRLCDYTLHCVPKKTGPPNSWW